MEDLPHATCTVLSLSHSLIHGIVSRLFVETQNSVLVYKSELQSKVELNSKSHVALGFNCLSYLGTEGKKKKKRSSVPKSYKRKKNNWF